LCIFFNFFLKRIYSRHHPINIIIFAMRIASTLRMSSAILKKKKKKKKTLQSMGAPQHKPPPAAQLFRFHQLSCSRSCMYRQKPTDVT
jgi:hypothetical protein